MTKGRIFLLSPASCAGERARLLLSGKARFSIALKLRSPDGAPLGQVFSFLSGLYFRGKLSYARRFAFPPEGVPGVFVITTDRGLLSSEERVTVRDLRRFARVPIHQWEGRYRRPLMRGARRIHAVSGGGCDVVLLGSIATGKYLDVLLGVFGDRLRFPTDFVGRGDMSRGGLMLRCVEEGRELEYVPVAGAARHGPRPPMLERRA